jgi:hypothetical protein
MIPIRTRIAAVVPALLVLLVLAPAGAHAATARTYAVAVTGIHVVDWQYQGEGYPDQCTAWSKGTGTQTLGIRTTKRARYMILSLPGVAPRLLTTKLGRYVGVARRTGSDWEDHAIPQTAACTPCGPLSEYGPCAEEPPPLAPLHDCARRNGVASAGVELFEAGKSYEPDGPAALVDALHVRTSVVAGFRSCPPTQPDGPGLHAGDPLEVSIVGAKVRRIRKLRRGRTLTLHGAEERGFAAGRESRKCSKPAGGIGYSECAVTDVTVEIRRLR